jgi:hypothetical protein
MAGEGNLYVSAMPTVLHDKIFFEASLAGKERIVASSVEDIS